MKTKVAIAMTVSILSILFISAVAYSSSAASVNELVNAAARGDLKQINKMTKSKINLNAKNANGETALHAAVKNRKVTALSFLLNAKANPNLRNRLQETPLHIAAKMGDESMMRILIRAKANVNAVDRAGRIPLHYAVQANSTNAVSLLLANQANPNIKDKDTGRTPLHNAVLSKNMKSNAMITALVRASADVNSFDSRSESPVSLAIKHVAEDKLQLLLTRNPRINVRNIRGEQYLHLAAKTYGAGAIIETLLKKGAIVDARNSFGETPLNVAISTQNSLNAEVLISRGANLDVRDKTDKTPLHSAIIDYYNEEIVFDILRSPRANAILNLVDQDGNSALHYAVTKKSDYLVDLLLTKKPQLNIVNHKGQTPTTLAKLNNNEKIKESFAKVAAVDSATIPGAIILGSQKALELLLESGKDINAPITDEEAFVREAPHNLYGVGRLHTVSPLVFAVAKKDMTITTFLLDKGAKVNHPETGQGDALALAIANNDLAIAELLLKNGADTSFRSGLPMTIGICNCALTPTYVALHKNNSDALNLLAKYGADLHSGIKYSVWESTPSSLYYAIQNKFTPKTIDTLIKLGANVNLVNEIESTPLHEAAFRGNGDIVKLLIAAGVAVDTKNKYGETPFSYAANEGHPDAVQALIDAGVNIHIKYANGKTPLYKALEYGHTAILQMLVAAGANVNEKNTDGNAPLHIATAWNKTDMMNLLLKAGANPNLKSDVDGFTPLHAAVVNNHVLAAKILLDVGADRNVKNNDGYSAFEMATLINRQEMLDVFE